MLEVPGSNPGRNYSPGLTNGPLQRVSGVSGADEGRLVPVTCGAAVEWGFPVRPVPFTI
jgi:hypothetical protein